MKTISIIPFLTIVFLVLTACQKEEVFINNGYEVGSAEDYRDVYVGNYTVTCKFSGAASGSSGSAVNNISISKGESVGLNLLGLAATPSDSRQTEVFLLTSVQGTDFVIPGVLDNNADTYEGSGFFEVEDGSVTTIVYTYIIDKGSFFQVKCSCEGVKL